MLKHYAKKYKCLLVCGFTLQVFGMVGEFASPYFIGVVIDAVNQKDMDRVRELVIYWIIINSASAVFAGIQRFVFQLITEKIGYDLRQDLFEEIIKKDVAFFDQRKTGDLISRLQADTSKIESALSTQISILIKSALYSVIVIGMFFYISWEMTLFTLGIMLPGMLSGPIYGRTMKRLNKEISDHKAAASAIAEEAFSNIRTVKAFATEDLECTEYGHRNNEVFGKARQAAKAYGIFNFFIQFIMFGSLDALVYFAAYLNGKDQLTIGQFT